MAYGGLGIYRLWGHCLHLCNVYLIIFQRNSHLSPCDVARDFTHLHEKDALRFFILFYYYPIFSLGLISFLLY